MLKAIIPLLRMNLFLFFYLKRSKLVGITIQFYFIGDLYDVPINLESVHKQDDRICHPIIISEIELDFSVA